ncbi:MAG: hypothetical protein N2688_15620, partial [Burkholderiaceae bacterium]|nr:hypothetical protein [Burkholderiaceae bacterium]
YQPRPGQQERNAGSNSPHDSGSPNPIFFLSVPPGSKFVFRVTCDPQYLSPGLRADNLWQQRLRQAFEHAFDWLGFGAKTAVGYGALRFDEQAQQKAQAELQQAQRQKQLASLTPAQRAIEEYAQYMAKRQQEIRGRKTLVGQQDYQRTQALAQQAQSPDWSPEEKRAAADAIEQWAPQIIQLELRELRKRLNLSALRT